MPLLYLLRHAKSDWGDPGSSDHERPLNARGRDAAPRVGAWLAAHHPRPALVRCSSARRTRETLTLLGDVTSGAEVAVCDDLYGATADELLAHLRTLPGERGPVLLVGHNPGVQQLVVTLTAAGQAVDAVARRFPTAALAVLRVPGAWAGLSAGSARLVDVVTPRAL